MTDGLSALRADREAEVLDEAEERQQAGWALAAPADLAYALELLRVSTRRQADAERIATAEVGRVQAWLTRQRAQHDRRADWLRAAIASYAAPARALLCAGRAKSASFPAGRVGWRARPERLEVRDEEAFSSWCAARDLVRTRVEPDRRAATEQYRKTGEVPDGCDVVGGDEAFFVEVDDG